jgi:NADPH2:quinone reductase
LEIKSMTTARVIRIHDFGGPEVLRLESIDLAAPGPAEVQIRQTAVGFNYIDVSQRKGIYPLPLPSGLGAYADRRNVTAGKVVVIPSDVTDRTAESRTTTGAILLIP